MFEEFAVQSFQTNYKPAATQCEPIREATSEAAENSVRIPSEGDATSQQASFDPSKPQFCKAIAEHHDCDRKTVQQWFIKVSEAYPWLKQEQLKLVDERYTPLCLKLMEQYQNALRNGLKFKGWKAQVQAENEEEYQSWLASQQSPAIRPDVLPRDDERYADCPVDRTAASSLVPTGSDYLNALEEEELELERLESEELALLNRMAGNLSRLTQNQEQWNRTNSLRRQRLLRQTRLEAAALATELEAEFDETLRESQYNIRRGNVVGKPPVKSQRSPSA